MEKGFNLPQAFAKFFDIFKTLTDANLAKTFNFLQLIEQGRAVAALDDSGQGILKILLPPLNCSSKAASHAALKVLCSLTSSHNGKINECFMSNHLCFALFLFFVLNVVLCLTSLLFQPPRAGH